MTLSKIIVATILILKALARNFKIFWINFEAPNHPFLIIILRVASQESHIFIAVLS